MLFECDLKEAVNLVRVSCVVSTGGAGTTAVNLLALSPPSAGSNFDFRESRVDSFCS